METQVVFVLSLLVLGLHEMAAAPDAMKNISSRFIKVLDECKRELNQTDHIVTDLYHFWKLDYSTLDRDTGCAIICMSKKLDLTDAVGKMHHGNAKQFAEKHGAEPELATQMVALMHSCEQDYTAIVEDCDRVLEVAKCFRTEIKELDWAPKVDAIVTEILSEI